MITLTLSLDKACLGCRARTSWPFFYKTAYIKSTFIQYDQSVLDYLCPFGFVGGC